jgi:hypothetical protein
MRHFAKFCGFLAAGALIAATAPVNAGAHFGGGGFHGAGGARFAGPRVGLRNGAPVAPPMAGPGHGVRPFAPVNRALTPPVVNFGYARGGVLGLGVAGVDYGYGRGGVYQPYGYRRGYGNGYDYGGYGNYDAGYGGGYPVTYGGPGYSDPTYAGYGGVASDTPTGYGVIYNVPPPAALSPGPEIIVLRNGHWRRYYYPHDKHVLIVKHGSVSATY